MKNSIVLEEMILAGVAGYL